jgi:putative ABC transport system permease protein
MMRVFRSAWARVRGAFGADARDRDLAAELDSHLQLHIDDNLRAGMPAAEARRVAVLRLGGLELTKEQYRDRRGLPWLDSLTRDCRDAWRNTRRAPRATTAIVATLALALGLNAAGFALTDALVLRPFSFPDVDDIVLLEEVRPGERFRGFTAPANVLDLRRQTRTLAFLSPVAIREVELGHAEEPEQLQAAVVSADYFDVIGVSPFIGRAFTQDEETFGRHHSVVIADSLWHRQFRSDPAVLGTTMVLDGLGHEIVGIAPPDFNFPFGAELWLPAAFEPAALTRRDTRTVLGVGRLAAGATVLEARAELTLLMRELARQHPSDLGRSSIRLQTLTRGMVEEGSAALHAFIQGLALIVLLIACGNVANLVLALGVSRRREIAVRYALGATRWQILRGLWIETLALALLAVPCALAVAHLGLRAMVSRMPPRIAPFVPGWDTIDVDGRLIVITTILAAAATATFGLLPALRTSRPNADALKEAARGVTGGVGRQRVRRALIVAQVALVLPLLVSAFAFAGGTQRFLNGPQGYDPEGVLRLMVALPERVFVDGRARTAFLDSVLDEVRGAAEVRSAAVANILPSTSRSFSRPVEIEGGAAPQGTAADLVEHRAVSGGYFQTMRIGLVAGRDFAASDSESAPQVGIVSRSMAERYWPGQDPLGRRVRYTDQPNTAWAAIVGVADNVVEDWYWGRDQETLYRPVAQTPPRVAALAVRTVGRPDDAAAAVANAIHRVDPSRPLLEVGTMRQTLSERLNAPRNVSVALATLGGVALLLAAIGLFSVINYLVTQRTHELGLRLALGATRAHIRQLIFSEIVRLTAIGLVIGMGLAAVATRLTQSFLAGIAAMNPPLFVALVAGVALLSLAAGWWPAHRAAVIDPSIALRRE